MRRLNIAACLAVTGRHRFVSDALSKEEKDNEIAKRPRFGTKHTQIIKSTQDTDIVRVKLLPLTLIEEVPPPQKVLSDLELLMMSWSAEQAVQMFWYLSLARILATVGAMFALYTFYRSRISFNRLMRGADNVPQNMKVGSVVYLDIENNDDEYRVIIGLLNELCPLMCEAFHRRCTASGGKGDSLRGIKMEALIPGTAAIFGEGRDMTHDVAGYNNKYLPTEHISNGPFRGAVSSIQYAVNQQSPNFAVHHSGSDNCNPQVFGIVLGGYDVFEKMKSIGTSHQNRPKTEFMIVDCGELCTLDKSHVVPMPWKVYESVSNGYDEERWGMASPDVISTSKQEQKVPPKKPWWKLW